MDKLINNLQIICASSYKEIIIFVWVLHQWVFIFLLNPKKISILEMQPRNDDENQEWANYMMHNYKDITSTHIVWELVTTNNQQKWNHDSCILQKLSGEW